MKNKELKEFIHNNVYQNPSNGYVLTPSGLVFQSIKKLPRTVFKSNSTHFSTLYVKVALGCSKLWKNYTKMATP